MIDAETPSRARLAVAPALVCAGLFSRAMRGAEPEIYTLHIASQPLDSARRTDRANSVFLGRSSWAM
jgi:hypothetical protein